MTTATVIRSDDLEVDFGLDQLDTDLNLVADQSENTASLSVTHGNFRTVHSTLKARISSPLQWETIRLRPWLRLTDLLTDETYTWNMGVYLPDTAKRLGAEQSDTYDVEAFDMTNILDTPYGDTYSLTEGSAYLAAVADLLDEALIPSYQVDQTAAADTIPANQVWQIAEENTYRRIIDDLLGQTGYRPIYMDRDGILRADPYVSPHLAADIWTYDSTDPQTIIEAEANDEQDLWKVANRYVFIADQPGELDPDEEPKLPVVGDGIYVVTNQSDGPASVDSRGRIVTAVYRVRSHCQACLEDRGDQIIELTSHVPVYLTMTTGPNPLHWHWDVATVNHSELGATGRFQSIEWTIDFTKGTMKHRMRGI